MKLKYVKQIYFCFQKSRIVKTPLMKTDGKKQKINTIWKISLQFLPQRDSREQGEIC